LGEVFVLSLGGCLREESSGEREGGDSSETPEFHDGDKYTRVGAEGRGKVAERSHLARPQMASFLEYLLITQDEMGSLRNFCAGAWETRWRVWRVWRRSD